MPAVAFPLDRSPSSLLVPLAALFSGAVLSAGVIAVADTGELARPPAKVIVVDSPAAGQGVAAKNEAGVAGAIALGPQLRGSKASAGPTPTGPAGAPADDLRPAGPRGLASGLSGR